MKRLLLSTVFACTSVFSMGLEDVWHNVVSQVSPQLIGGKIPTLINGTVPDMSKFQGSVRIQSGNAGCTATVVGSRVVATAAHCVSAGNITFSVGPSRYSGQCRTAREYNGNSTADYAYCYTDKEVLGIVYDVVNLDPNYLKVGERVLLTGYGCTRPGGTGTDGQYRVGLATVNRLPSGTNNDIVTSNGAALCFGDSGGPAFGGVDAAGVHGKLISVNSRGNIATTSYLSATHTPIHNRFIAAWAALYPDARICGFHKDAQGCRGMVPPVPNSFDVDHPMVSLKGQMKKGFEGRLEEAKELVSDALVDLK
jgi:V8-like Glu-specific endopeptidase